MAFNLYLAGAYANELEPLFMEKGINRLYSQLNDRRLGQMWLDYSNNVERRKIFVDSGAFTAHTKGKELDVDEYIEYVNERQGSFQAIAQVDTIPGEFGKPKTLKQLAEAPELSWQNYLYMRERVIDKDCLLPIFHQGEDFKHLQRILEWTDENGKHIPYIGISPANDLHTKQKDVWLSTVFKVIKSSSNPKVKTHGFGLTSLPLLERYPFYSADSTKWLLTGVMGTILTPFGGIVVSNVQKDNSRHYSNLPHEQQEVIDEYLSKFGITLKECSEEYVKRALYNAMYLHDWAQNYEYKGNNSFQKRLF